MTNLSMSLYYPLVLLAAAWGVLQVAGGLVAKRGRAEAGANLETLGFGALLAAAAWGVVLTIMAIVRYPSRTSDLALILVTVGVFFALLLGVLFVLGEVRVGGRSLGTYVGGLVAAASLVLIVLAIV